MAIPLNLVVRTGIRGDREDLIDKIFQVSPTETPISSAAKKVTASSTFHEWQRDSLAAPNGANAAIDGDDATLQVQVATERVGNHCQIFTKVIGVSRRTQIIKKAGRGAELPYLKAKAASELKRDIEAMIVSNAPAVAAVGGTVAGRSAGLGVQLYRNASQAAGGSTTAWTNGAPTVAPVVGTPRAFVVSQLNTVQQGIFSNAGTQPDMIVVGPAHKAVFSTFVGIAANRLDTGKKQGTVVSGADVFIGDFGTLQVVPHYMMVGATDAWILNMDFIDLAFLDGVKTSELAKTGDSDRILMTADVALAVRSSDANGKVSGLSGG